VRSSLLMWNYYPGFRRLSRPPSLGDSIRFNVNIYVNGMESPVTERASEGTSVGVRIGWKRRCVR
jgi:hypothetical protein